MTYLDSNCMFTNKILTNTIECTSSTEAGMKSQRIETQYINDCGAGYDIVGHSQQGNIYLGDANRSSGSDTNIYAGGHIRLTTTTYLGASGTTKVTSDRNAKTDITALDNKYVDMFDNIKPVTFKYKDGNAGRLHCGFIAQDIKDAMDAAGISDMEFAGWCKEKNDDEGFIVKADDGTIPEYTYALGYEEFIPILTAKIKAQDARIEKLEKQLTAK